MLFIFSHFGLDISLRSADNVIYNVSNEIGQPTLTGTMGARLPIS